METPTLIPVEEIDESPSNPRKLFREIEELAESIEKNGLLQPVAVRSKTDGRWELIFGARRLRASSKAGLSEIPAFVREMSDREVLELQIIENGQRSDVHPLEEADGFRALLDDHGATVAETAARGGKSESHVYKRLKLCELCDEARKAFFEGTIPLKTALALARISPKENQEKATTEVLDGFGYSEPMTPTEAVRHIERKYMLVLKDAPFGVRDAKLVPEAGACAGCPKRTGAHRVLFDDLDETDRCTDSECFERKIEALWEKRCKTAKRKGETVLPEADSERLFVGKNLACPWKYVDLDETCGEDPEKRTWGALLRKAKPDVVHARDELGGPHQLVETEEAHEHLARLGYAFAQDEEEEADDAPHESEAVLEHRRSVVERSAGRLVEARVMAEIGDQVAKGSVLTRDQCAALVGLAMRTDLFGGCLERRGLPTGYGPECSEALRSWTSEASADQLLALLVEWLLEFSEIQSGDPDEGEDDFLNGISVLWGIDLEAVRTRASEDVAAYLTGLADSESEEV